MWKFGVTVAAGIIGSLFAGQAQAVVCTGTTTTVANGGSVTAAFLLGAGNCVSAGDKTFGQFSVSGAITGTGSASFSWSTPIPSNVTMGFAGVVNPNSTGTLTYHAAVNALAQNFLISGLEKDFTLNAAVTGAPASAALSGIVTPGAIAFNCTRTVNPSGGTCPVSHTFAPVSEITVTETIATGANAIVTALTDTIQQVAGTTVPEPASLALLGTALVGFGFAARRRRSQGDA